MACTQTSVLLLAFSGHAEFLAHVPVPLGNLTWRHADLERDLHLSGVAPDGRLIEVLLQQLLLALVLGHALALLIVGHVPLGHLVLHLLLHILRHQSFLEISHLSIVALVVPALILESLLIAVGDSEVGRRLANDLGYLVATMSRSCRGAVVHVNLALDRLLVPGARWASWTAS